ncbi:hypothetical protein HYS94_01520 [Candidatus Daviesbacteria bacterium]|nr:hypothetical protein [Candidatus Daviesbacteria bacterium]
MSKTVVLTNIIINNISLNFDGQNINAEVGYYLASDTDLKIEKRFRFSFISNNYLNLINEAKISLLKDLKEKENI